jgi:arabinan endo-1,5-alpha-L-arabinosidase
LIIAGNNAIDPAVLIDGSNAWLSYDNWQTSLDIIQINPSNGLHQGDGRWDLVNEVEASGSSRAAAPGHSGGK